jgi:hypothetical protein
MKVKNTFIIFIVSGFWHGANWTFVIWGLLNAIYFLPLLLFNKNRDNLEIVAQGKWIPSLKELFQMTITFTLTVFAWIFFRAESLSHAMQYISGIFSKTFFHLKGSDFIGTRMHPYVLFLLLGFFILIEWLGREQKFALEKIGLNWNRPFRWFFYMFIVFLLGMFMATEETPFIYFQF